MRTLCRGVAHFGQCLTIIVCFMMSCVCVSPVLGGPPAALTVEELKERLAAAQRQFQRIYVEYRCEDYDPQSESYVPGVFLRRVVAASQPDSVLHLTSHGHSHLQWTDDPLQQNVRIQNNRVVNEFPLRRAIYSAPLNLRESGLPGSLSGEFLFFATGVWPLDGVKPLAPDGDPWVLSDVAKAVQYSEVRPELSLLEGRWCHVLCYPGRDELWLDIERSCALLARETKSKSTGRLAQRIELGEHKEVVPGIWFPMKIRNIQFDHNATDVTKQGRVWKNALHHVVEVRINGDDSAQFNFSPLPGTIQVQDDDSFCQIEPGGTDHIDILAAWVKRHRSSRAAGGAADAFCSFNSAFGSTGSVRWWSACLIAALIGCDLVWQSAIWRRPG